jgi:uncharacterized membrane protein YdbT with pleckstrin-like domain
MYIDQVLVQGESVVYRGHLSVFTLMPGILLGVILLPLGPIFWIRAWLRYRSTELAVTNRRVIAKFGLVQRRTVEMNLDKVESLQVEQTFWGRVLGYGTLLVRGTGNSLEPIPGISQPIEFRRAVMESTDSLKVAPPH